MSTYIKDLHLVTPERSTKRLITNPDLGAPSSATTTVTPAQAYSHQFSSAVSTTSLSSSSSFLDHTPVSPTFPMRQSTRFSSANSSIAGSPVVRSSLDGHFKMKHSLTEVREEKESARDEVSTIIEDIATKDYLDATSAFPDYDWVDTPPYEGSDFDFSASKRRCGGDGSPDGGISARLTERFPSIAKKLKSKREKRTSSVTGSMHEVFMSRSRASSLRSTSILEKNNDIPPTPPPIHQEATDAEYDVIMQVDEEEEREAEDQLGEEQRVALSRTPLLPPVLAVSEQQVEEPIQSPLQSPTVDATSSLPQSPCDSPHPFRYLPSPPLSTKPSVASFHHRSILPSAEIPAINLTEAKDEWSARLGHGNFTITPEPYQLEGPVTLEACQRLKADWEEAKVNFELHRERTAEVYSDTSKIYHLTLVKWAEINLRWRLCLEEAQEAVPRLSQEALQTSFNSQEELTTTTTVPNDTAMTASITSLPSEARGFPAPGVGGIVGPMEQVKPLAPRNCRKRSFWRFLQGVWPSGNFGVSQA